jgi:hypothetical protein
VLRKPAGILTGGVLMVLTFIFYTVMVFSAMAGTGLVFGDENTGYRI